MQNFDSISRIKSLCAERGFSYYELAKRSNIPYSTLNTMILKNNSPTLPTLCKLCEGFGISLIQFFYGNDQMEALTDEQKECLKLFSLLDSRERELAIAFMRGMLHKID